jgi:3-phenylpropionate/trans-cinnamate dioxygenase ferredoxin subunit
VSERERAAIAAGGFTAVATVDEMPSHGLLGVILPGGVAVCLIRSGGEIYAVEDVCTHQAFPISAGELREEEGGTVECTWHGARFECATGAVQRGPALDPLPTFDVRVEHGHILVGPRKAAGGESPRGCA